LRIGVVCTEQEANKGDKVFPHNCVAEL
jgi:hypothetical protein